MTNANSNQKRRVVYMDDEIWAKAATKATNNGQSISDFLRGLVVNGTVVVTPEEHRVIPGRVASDMPTMRPGGAPRSTTTPSVSNPELKPTRTKTVDPEPFRQFRPVPKPGSKK